jgi:hypothetical protein
LNGQRLRLEAARIGGRWLTSVQALDRFIARQTPEFSDQPPVAERSVQKRESASRRAEKELKTLGA